MLRGERELDITAMRVEGGLYRQSHRLTVSRPVSVVRHALRVGLGRQPQLAAHTGGLVVAVQRLRVLHEAPAVVVVLAPPVSDLLLVHGVLAASVPLDKADYEADAEEEDDGEKHPDEPAGGGEGALLRLVAGRDVQVRVHTLGRVEME